MAKLKGGSYVAGLLTVEGACIAEEFSKPDGATLVTILTASPPTAGIIPKVGASASSLTDSIISELDGVITVGGALATNSLRIGDSVASIDALGNVAGKSLAVTGAITSGSLAATEAVTGASLAVTGAVNSASIKATGAVESESLSVTEAVTCASIQATGNISADTLSIKDAVTAYKLRFVCSSSLTAERTLTLNTNNANRVITLDADLSVSAASVTLTGSGAGSTLALPAGTTTFSALTSGHVLYASAENTVSGEASLSVSRGGTARATLTANYLLYGDGTNAVGLLAPNTTTTPKFLSSVSSGVPAWYTIPNAALDNSEITINGTAVSLGSSITISTGSVNHAKSTSAAYYNVLWVEQDVGGLTQVWSTDTIQVYPSTGTLKATNFNATSLRSAKIDIKPFRRNALEIIRNTQICTYYYKIDESKEHLRTGFIADDTDEALATKNHDSMDIASSLGVLMKAVQELDAIVQKQAAEIENLKQPFWKRWFL